MEVIDRIIQFINNNKDVILNLSEKFDNDFDDIYSDQKCTDFLSRYSWLVVTYSEERYLSVNIDKTNIDILINQKFFGILIVNKNYERYMIELFPIETILSESHLKNFILLSTDNYSMYKELL